MAQTKQTYERFLRPLPEFCEFTDAEFQTLMAQMQVKTYPKGQVLFDYGDSRDRFYFVIKGVIRLERLDETGNFTFINYVKTQTGFPYRGLYSGQEYPYTATALTPITVALLSMSTLEQLIATNPQVTKQVLRQMSFLIDRTETRLQKLVTSSAANRVVQALIVFGTDMGELGENGQVTIPYPITLIELARLSGTTRETAGQVVSKLEAAGKLRYQKKRFCFNPVDLKG